MAYAASLKQGIYPTLKKIRSVQFDIGTAIPGGMRKIKLTAAFLAILSQPNASIGMTNILMLNYTLTLNTTLTAHSDINLGDKQTDYVPPYYCVISIIIFYHSFSIHVYGTNFLPNSELRTARHRNSLTISPLLPPYRFIFVSSTIMQSLAHFYSISGNKILLHLHTSPLIAWVPTTFFTSNISCHY